jgi:hypothetical protein
MDLQSIMGYAHGSPYNNAPYLDINTPEGLITMENTPIDLMGVDNLGNVKRMKAGAKKQYKFPGTQVREIPVGNPYQQGGMTGKQLFDFLFDDDEPENTPAKAALPTAPSTDEVDIQTQMNELEMQRRQFANEQNDALAMQVLMEQSPRGNPYSIGAPEQQSMGQGNPYAGEIKSSGQFGSQNIGEYGKQIYGQLAGDLGYAPTVNSIYRSKAQQDALIAAGAPAAKNSWHLTGNAIDLKPTDWHKLSNEKQLYYRQNYDVVYHDNHYHIEPKN